MNTVNSSVVQESSGDIEVKEVVSEKMPIASHSLITGEAVLLADNTSIMKNPIRPVSYLGEEDLKSLNDPGFPEVDIKVDLSQIQVSQTVIQEQKITNSDVMSPPSKSGSPQIPIVTVSSSIAKTVQPQTIGSSGSQTNSQQDDNAGLLYLPTYSYLEEDEKIVEVSPNGRYAKVTQFINFFKTSDMYF